eukprot:g1058.t1
MDTTSLPDTEEDAINVKLLRAVCRRKQSTTEDRAKESDEKSQEEYIEGKETTTSSRRFAIEAYIVGWGEKVAALSSKQSQIVDFSMTETDDRGEGGSIISMYDEDKSTDTSIRVTGRYDGNFYESLANSFLRVELSEMGNVEEEESAQKKTVGTASIDIGRCLIWPKTQLGCGYSIRLSIRNPAFDSADVTISLRVSNRCVHALRRSRLFELTSAVCEEIPQRWIKSTKSANEEHVRYALCLPQFSIKDKSRLEAVATFVDGSLQWDAKTYPDDLCPFGPVAIDLDAPPAFRAFVSDEAAISLRQRLKDNQSICKAVIVQQQRRSKDDNVESAEEVWDVVHRAGVAMDLSALLRPGVATASCNASLEDVVDVSSNDEDGASKKVVDNGDNDTKERAESALRFLLESSACNSFASNQTLNVSQVFQNRKPRPKLPRLSEERQCILLQLQRDLAAVATSIASEYDSVTDVAQDSKCDSNDVVSKTIVAERLARDGKIEGLRQRLLDSVLGVVRSRLKSASSKRMRREIVCELNTYLMVEVDRCVRRMLGVSETEATCVKKVNDRDDRLSFLATEAEAYGAHQAAAEYHRARLALDFSTDVSKEADAWDAYGRFCCRAGKLDDAVACFEEALELTDYSKASLILRKASILANLRDFDGCSRTIAILEVDKMGKDTLTHEQGTLANVLLALYHDQRGGRMRRDAAMKAAGNRYMLDRRAVFSESSATSNYENGLFDPDELSRKLPRTVSALGGLIPRKFSHVKRTDVLMTYVQATFWFQRQGLFDVADKLLRMFCEDLEVARASDSNECCGANDALVVKGENIVEIAQGSANEIKKTETYVLHNIAHVLESKQRLASGDVAGAEKLVRGALSNGVEGYARVAAARVLAECVRNKPLEERSNLELAIETRRANCAKELRIDDMRLTLCVGDDGDDRDATVEDLHAQFRLGLLYLSSSDTTHVESKRVFEDMLSKWPSSVRAKVCLVRAYLQAGAIAEAENIACAMDCDDYPGAFAALALVDLSRSPPNIASAAKFTHMAMRRNLRDDALIKTLIGSFSEASETGECARDALKELRGG